MKKQIFTISIVAAAFIGCGGGGGGGLASAGLPSYSSQVSANKSAYLPVASSLYKGAQLVVADDVHVRASSAGDLSFPRGWAGAFAAASVVAGIIDGGVDFDIAPSMEGYYTYGASAGGPWPSIQERLDGSRLTHHSYTRELMEGGMCSADLDGGKCQHGREVASTLKSLLPNAKFVNITVANLPSDGDLLDVGASVDAAAKKGVRFFNRSFGTRGDFTASNPGDFLMAVGYKNALVVNAAGNNETGGQVTTNSLDPRNPLRAGWIIALGYGDYAAMIDGQAQKPTYYVELGGKKHYIYPRGNSCKSFGASDCIAAPYTTWVKHPQGTDGKTVRLDGTSFSSPMVLAAAMAVYAKFPWMSNANIKQTLFSTAYKVQGGTAAEREKYFGAGVLNAAAAMHGPARFDGDFIADVSEGLYVFSNDISGAGGLVKNGVGTLALGGNNTFSGDVFNTDGELWLLGSNRADFYNDARMRLKRAQVGRLQNSGDLISEGFAARELSLGANSRMFINFGELVRVDGAAKLGGDLVVAGLARGYIPSKGTSTERVIAAGSVSGEFASVRSASGFLKVESVDYSASDVSLSVQAKSAYDLPELDAYAAKNYQSLFDYFDLLAGAQKFTSKDGVSLSAEQMRGYFGPEVFASAVQNMSAQQAARAADGLFGRKAGRLAANALASVRGIAGLLGGENTPSFGGFFMGNKAGGLSRSTFGTILSAQKDLGAASIKAGLALARDDESADIWAANFGASYAASEALKIYANAGAAGHRDELKSRAIFAELGAKYQLASGANYAAYAQGGGDVFAMKNSSVFLAPSEINSGKFTSKSLYAKGIYEYFAPNFAAEFSGGLRKYFDSDYHFAGVLEGAKVVGAQKMSDSLSAMLGAKISFELNERAKIWLEAAAEFGRKNHTNSASAGFKYSF